MLAIYYHPLILCSHCGEYNVPQTWLQSLLGRKMYTSPCNRRNNWEQTDLISSMKEEKRKRKGMRLDTNALVERPVTSLGLKPCVYIAE